MLLWESPDVTRFLRIRVVGLILLASCPAVFNAHADCSLTNLGVTPLNEMAFASYASNKGGLYPNGLNTRPPAHELAGIAIANAIQPLDTAGNINTNTGKIGLLSLGMSNTTLEWGMPGADNFTSQATNDPSLNPRVVIADGGIPGQDAPDWTNLVSSNWSMVVTSRLVFANLTTNQVQVVWLKQALQFAGTYGAFPAHAQKLREAEEQILRNAKTLFPNLKIAYLSSRTRAYTNADPSAPNPEPYAFESGFAVRWVVEDQIKGTNNLNYNPTNGPVVAPWLSWGPYLWADGMTPRGDGLIWQCGDVVVSDYMHPSSSGIQMVGTQLLAFFKTDPTATPWFLKPSGDGAPTCAPTANVTNGFRPLTVNFFAHVTNGTGGLRDGKWTFEDGEFATNANPVKVFKTPGLYHARFTVTDTNGNTAQGMVAVKVNAKLTDWLYSKFSAADLLKSEVSGPTANPDGDPFPNLLEFALGLEPTESDPPDTVTTTFANNVFTLTFPHYKYAGDAPLTLEVTSDFVTWTPLAVAQSEDDDPVELLTYQEPMTNSAPRFFRLRAQLLPTQ
jgi:PKD repeat protein